MTFGKAVLTDSEWRAISRRVLPDIADRTKHDLYGDRRSEVTGVDRIDFVCTKCHGDWWIDITGLSAGPVVDILLDLQKVMGTCRGAPLYREIPGTPWFDYSRKPARSAA